MPLGVSTFSEIVRPQAGTTQRDRTGLAATGKPQANDTHELAGLLIKTKASLSNNHAGRHRPTGRPVLVGNPPGSNPVAKTSG